MTGKPDPTTWEQFSALDQRRRPAEMHLTYRCDLGCPTCNRACFVQPPVVPDMSLGRFVDTLNQIESLDFVKRLVIIGGEPTLHPEFLTLLKIGHDRGFDQTIWSNGYSSKAKQLLSQVQESGVASIYWATHKERGPQKEFNVKTIFCSPKDCGKPRKEPGCLWLTKGCGYSVDELGITPCPIGGAIEGWVCLQGSRTNSLDDLLDLRWLGASLSRLCKHCGAFMGGMDRHPSVVKVRCTPMSPTWLRAFNLGDA
jgi:hypothetical protein